MTDLGHRASVQAKSQGMPGLDIITHESAHNLIIAPSLQKPFAGALLLSASGREREYTDVLGSKHHGMRAQLKKSVFREVHELVLPAMSRE